MTMLEVLVEEPSAHEAMRHLLPPQFPGNFKQPDNGGTWERLHRFLKKHGVYRGTYPKIEAAGKIAPHLDPARNCSPSFRQFCSGLEALL